MAESIPSFDSDRPSLPWLGTDRYEILGVLGRGGMGIVYEAFERDRHRRVALKTLPHVDAASLFLFKQEFRTLADVQHTNLVHLYELELTEAGPPFFTMELVRGCDFRDYVERPEAGRRSKVVSVRPVASETVRPAPEAGRAARPLSP